MSNKTFNPDNFIGTEYEGMNEAQIFNATEKYVKATIKRQFSNHAAFCQTHMIDYEDLISYGYEGVLKAIRSYNPELGKSVMGHTIDYISYSIRYLSNKESLRTTKTRSTEAADVFSLDNVDGDEDSGSLLDALAVDDGGLDTFSLEILTFLNNHPDTDEDIKFIIMSKMKGDTDQEISKALGISRQAVTKKLITKKATRVKNDLLLFVKGDGNYGYLN